MKLNAKQLELVDSCSSVEELLEKASAEKLELTPEQAQLCLERAQMVELDEDDLDLVAGGCNTSQYDGVECPWCHSTNTDCTKVQEGGVWKNYHCLTCNEKFSTNGTSWIVMM